MTLLSEVRSASRSAGSEERAARAERSRPLRVVLVISNLEYGGAQRQVIDLANSVDPARLDVHVCSLSDYLPLADRLRDRDRRLHVIHKSFKYDVTVPIRLAALLKRLDADVAHSFLFDAEIATRVAGGLARTPLVVGSERNTDYHIKRVQRAAYAVTRRMVHLVIANSRAGAAFSSRTLGQPKSLYRVIHNGVDTDRFRPGPADVLRRLVGLDEDVPIVGMFGSLKAQKNHPLFFAAAASILKAMPKTRFLLVGDQLYGGMHGSDAYKARVMAMVAEMGLREHCLFLGNRNDVELLYPVCDLTVLPSLFEGTPNVALESMACAVPVVATDVSDNALVVPDGRAGLIVPLDRPELLAGSVLTLLSDRNRRVELGRAARDWVEREFSLGRLAEKTEVAYREALDARASLPSRMAA